ncbi:MAG TPA: BON domain-containing protein [Aquabacterium sp.]|nr:BON domain-containing protein [Aquabacterium sp.]
MKKSNWRPRASLWATGLMVVGALAGCAPLVLGTAAGGAFMATDRRTSGAQVEDQGIEIKAANRLRDVLSDRAHVNVTSYNRLLLLTGEAPTAEQRAAAEKEVRGIENLEGVVNEIAVMPASSVSSRANDLVLATKVRATLVDAPDLISNAYKVVVERGEVYMMGLVTEREAKRAAELTSTIKGVRRVVKVFQILTEDELANKLPAPTRLNGTPLNSPAASAPAASTETPAASPAATGVTTTPLSPADPVQVQPLPPSQP